MKREIQAILNDTPSYDPAMNLKADEIGKVLNRLIEQISEVVQKAPKTKR